MAGEITIRPYRPEDEAGWLRCRVLAFLDTAYYDGVEREKPAYENQSIELVAETGGVIAGLIDVEIEPEPGTLGLPREERAAVIWNVAVHPDHRRRGIARRLLEAAMPDARAAGARALEAWTRDDPFVRHWYEEMGFEVKDAYLHVYLADGVTAEMPGMIPQETFAHYVGDDPDAVRAAHDRVYECVCFERPL